MNRPKSGALSAYRAKMADAKERLKGTFIAYVRTRHRGKSQGYVVYATDGTLSTWENEYFMAFFTTPKDLQTREVGSVIDHAARKVRTIYSERAVHSTVIANVLGSYLQYTLENAHEPLALGACVVLVDCVEKFNTIDFTGYTERHPTKLGGAGVHLVGCYDDAMRVAVTAAIRKHLISQTPTKSSQRALAIALCSITKHRRAGSLPIRH